VPGEDGRGPRREHPLELGPHAAGRALVVVHVGLDDAQPMSAGVGAVLLALTGDSSRLTRAILADTEILDNVHMSIIAPFEC